jgi:hypothetical protein
VSIKPESRSNYAPTIRVVNSAGFLVEREHLDIRPTLVTTVHSDNQEFVPLSNDNWSRISWRKLGHGRRYWIIADYSNIVDPWTELQPIKVYKVVAQLNANVVAGTINQISLTRTKGVSRGQVLRVENLDPMALVSFDCSVLAVNPIANTVDITPVAAPSVPALLSRVSVVSDQPVKLTCPSVQRAFFEALNFGNPLNTLVE